MSTTSASHPYRQQQHHQQHHHHHHLTSATQDLYNGSSYEQNQEYPPPQPAQHLQHLLLDRISHKTTSTSLSSDNTFHSNQSKDTSHTVFSGNLEPYPKTSNKNANANANANSNSNGQSQQQTYQGHYVQSNHSRTNSNIYIDQSANSESYVPQNPTVLLAEPDLEPKNSSHSLDLLTKPPSPNTGGLLRHNRSSSSLPPKIGDTPLGARSFSSPVWPSGSNESSRVQSPSSHHFDLGNNNNNNNNNYYQKRAHDRQSKSVDLSHLYLLDRNESTHFTLTNESLSDVSHNMIKQYLGESSSSSLLPRMKTIELYRKNVKKSNNPKVLFQYAQYMLQTALTIDTTKQSTDGEILENDMKKQFLKEAVHYLKKLSDKGYTDAQYLLGDAHSSGALGKIDNKEAFSLFQSAAKHGHVESAYRTAYCYEEGLGVSRDSRRALEFLKYAASKNHPSAMYKLGVYSFYSRMGLPDNVNIKKSGIQWLSRAVTKANELINAAPYELAKIHEQGFKDIVIPDRKYAMELYVQAASLGHIRSAAILGKAYEFGDEIINQDSDLSIHYYTQAALGGDAESMLSLCAWYLVGNPPNLPKDEYEAFQWAFRSASLNYVKAQFAVGNFYEKGIGCDKNLDQAKEWYKKAEINGDEKASKKLGKLNGIINSNQSTDSSSIRDINDKKKLNKKKSKNLKKSKNEKDCIIM